MRRPVRAAAWLLVLSCGTANAYPVDVSMASGGLHVEALASQLGAATILELINGEPFAVRCDVYFRNGPERRRRKVTVEAAGRHTVRFSPTRDVVRVRVSVECWPAHPAEGADPEADPDIDQIIDDE